MNSLFDPQISQKIIQRIENLQVDSPRQWGKMDVAQMLAHCVVSLEVAVGDKNPPRTFIAKLIGGFMKGMLTNDKPMPKGSPTNPAYLIVDERDFENEKNISNNLNSITYPAYKQMLFAAKIGYGTASNFFDL